MIDVETLTLDEQIKFMNEKELLKLSKKLIKDYVFPKLNTLPNVFQINTEFEEGDFLIQSIIHYTSKLSNNTLNYLIIS